jgi:uncharacterized protein YifE (UPF0438 family)
MFLDEDEVDLLEKYGDLLEGLASGDITPSTPNQRRFVEAANNGFSDVRGLSEKVWKKYLRITAVLDQNSALSKQVNELKSQIDALKNENRTLDMCFSILACNIKEPKWDEQALAQLSDEDRNLLRKYEKTLVLRDSKDVPKALFDEFTASTGVWKSLHNYEKVKNPRAFELKSGKIHARLTRCHACDSPIINGHCKCSR